MKRLILAIITSCIILLGACSSNNPEIPDDTIETGTTEIATETVLYDDSTTETTPEIIPDPYYFDDYGVKYVLVEGTDDEYEIDESYRESMETPDSSALIEISYWPYGRELRVQFRNSGAWYTYYDVPAETWHDFKNAESKGSYYNQYIKGYFECTKDQ